MAKKPQGFTTDVKPKSNQSAAPSISANDSSSRGFTFAILGLVVVGLAAVAFLATNRATDLSDAEQTAPVEVSGAPIVSYPRDAGVAVTNASNDPAVGTQAPTLVGTSFDGTEVRVEGDGTPKAVYFLAHHCPFCQEEVPVIQALIDSGRQPDGMDVLAISTSVQDLPNRNYPPEVWLNRENFTPSVMRDSDLNRAFSAYGGTSFPYTVYLDGDNNIVARSAGQLDESITLALWESLAVGAEIDSVEGDGENLTDVNPDGTPTEEPEEETPAE